MEYLKFLDYVLTVLNENPSEGDDIFSLSKRFNKTTNDKINEESCKHFVSLYKNKYFEQKGTSNFYIICPETKTIIDKYGSFLEYYKIETEKINESHRIKNTQLKKLENDAKLSNWQVIAFPYVFIIGIISGLYSIISILYLLFGESTDDKINRLLDNRLKSIQSIEHVINDPIINYTDTLNKYNYTDTLKK